MTRARFIPADPALPGLKDLFPVAGAPEFVGPEIRKLTGVDVDPATADVTYVRYWPGRRCVVQWTFPGESEKLVISAELQPRRGKKHQGTFAGQLYLEDRSLLLQAFPYDDVLPGIERAVSRDWMETRLAAALGLSAAETATLRASPTSYKPWRRCVVIYEWQTAGEPRRCYGKLFRDDRGAALFETLRALDERLANSELRWGIAKPLFYDGDTRILVQADIEGGACLSDIARAAPDDIGRRAALRETLEQAASGLKTFQDLSMSGLVVIGAEDLIREVEQDVQAIARVDPDLADEIGSRLNRTRELLGGLEEEPQGITHNAFRLSHIFRTADGLSLIDLDALAIGGASADAGYFLAYLAVTAAHRKRLRGVLTQSASEFSEALSRSVSHDPRWLGFYAQIALLKWAVRSFYSLDVDWTDNVDDYLKIGRRMIASLDKSTQLGDPLLRFASSHRFLEQIAREQVIPAFWPGSHYADMANVDTIYEPDEECIYLADFEVADDASGIRSEKLVVTFPVAHSLERGGLTAGRQAIFESPYGEFLAEAYPSDYRLPGLANAHREGYVKGLLAAAGEEGVGGKVESALLRYRPHERAVLRWDCADGRRYVAKVFDARKDAEEVWAALTLIRPQLRDSSLVVRPVALDREGAVVVMEFIEGRTLGQLMDETTDEAEMERYTGIAAGVLAQVHAVDFEHASVKTYASEVRRLQKTARTLEDNAPEFASEVASLLDRAAEIADRLGPLEAPSIVHGGYKPTQLLVHNGRATLVDFDGTSLGDPGIDVGRFMAKLRADAFDRPRRHLSTLPERFYEQYRAQSRRDVSRAPLFEVNSLLRMAMRRFQTKPELLLDDDSTSAWKLLRQAQGCLGQL